MPAEVNRLNWATRISAARRAGHTGDGDRLREIGQRERAIVLRPQRAGPRIEQLHHLGTGGHLCAKEAPDRIGQPPEELVRQRR